MDKVYPPEPPSPRWRSWGKQPSGDIITPPISRTPSPRNSPRRDSSPTPEVQTEVDGEGNVENTPVVVQSTDPLTPTMPFLGAAKAGDGMRKPLPAYTRTTMPPDERMKRDKKCMQEATSFYLGDEKEVMKRGFETFLNNILATVTRVVRHNSNEARNNPKALEAIDREIENIRSKDALFWLET